jgi:hypothetical protein
LSQVCAVHVPTGLIQPRASPSWPHVAVRLPLAWVHAAAVQVCPFAVAGHASSHADASTALSNPKGGTIDQMSPVGMFRQWVAADSSSSSSGCQRSACITSCLGNWVGHRTAACWTMLIAAVANQLCRSL